VRQNFLIRSSETAYLFFQHFMGKLQTGERAGIVNVFLSDADNANGSFARIVGGGGSGQNSPDR
jgi:type I restriction enzyme M protein